MAIRLRKVEGWWVALCAVESDPKPGDVYLDDGQHGAVYDKFSADFQSMGFLTPGISLVNEEHERRAETQIMRDARVVSAVRETGASSSAARAAGEAAIRLRKKKSG